MELEVSPNKPKLSLPTLEMQNNCYVVQSKEMYHYFPVKIEEDPSKPLFLKFKKTPPVLVDGYVFYKKELYEVSSDDILRLRVRKSKVIKREASNGKSNTRNSDPAGTSSGASTQSAIQRVNQSRISRAAVLEVDVAADASWEEQTESLLHLVSSKEGGEWEIEGVA
jgi:hypothetical protein